MKNKKLQKKYDNLSLVERNAYDQILERNKISFMGLPYAGLRVLIDFGLLFIIVAIIAGVDVGIFREGYAGLVSLVYAIVGISVVLILLSPIINIFRLNKLKRQILKE